MTSTPIPGRFELVRVGAGNRSTSHDRTFRRAVERGELVRVRRGVFVAASRWHNLQPIERHRLTVAAAVDAAPALTVSHGSAAALWGVPMVGPAPVDVEVLCSPTNGTRREGGFHRRASRDLEIEVVDLEGMRVTSVLRTVVDLAASLPFREGVVAVDWALARGIDREGMSRLAMTIHWAGALKRAVAAIAFGDARSGSPGESVSRALFREMGFPAPELQTRFSDRTGLIGLTDFYWRRWLLIGEFDGLAKYRSDALLRGRTPAQVVTDEKRREDRLRATGPRVVRWLWPDLIPERLGPILLDAGLPRSA
ncbi:hypothetical protein [Amnibacterium sp.]|uniref:hypothetical protein n=1 Tax=Amnibacterium sp. TaxID=1872496 RepID=UPI002609E7A2|nr:hypothetical protein [Amnibacterium sp.]